MEFQVIQKRQSRAFLAKYGDNQIAVTLSNRSEHNKNCSYSFRVVAGAKVNIDEKYVIGKANSGELVFLPSENGYKFVRASNGSTRVMRIDLVAEALSAIPKAILSKVDSDGRVAFNGDIDSEKRIWIHEQ